MDRRMNMEIREFIIFFISFVLGGAFGIFGTIYGTWLRDRKAKENQLKNVRIPCRDYNKEGERNLYCYNCIYDRNCPYEEIK